MPSLEDVRAAKQVIRGQLLQLGLGGGVVGRVPTLSVSAATERAGRSVHAVGVGRKLSEGQPQRPLCIRVYVVQKLPESLLSPRDIIPSEIDGVPTDVVEANPAFLLAKKPTRAKKRGKKSSQRAAARPPETSNCSHNRRKRQRPLVGGISAGHRDITAGTLGCCCRSMRPGDDPQAVYALSNNHVFANVNAALVGDPLYQPGPLDGGTFQDHFANLERFVEIKLGGVEANRVDAAIGRLLEHVPHEAEICTIGAIAGTMDAEEDMPVRKHGRTTGLTEGRIDDIEYDALVGMDHDDPSVVALFENQLRIVSAGTDPIGLGGDSGSAVVHANENRIVGLYFAGPPAGGYGVANRIEHVLQELQVAIL